MADLAESRDAYNRLVESSADGQADHESSVTIVNESDGAEIQLLTTKNNELSAENKELSARLEQLTNENRELNEAYLDMNEKVNIIFVCCLCGS